MRLLALVAMVALAGSQVAQEAMCRCSQEAAKPSSCCCGDACAGTCCCAGKSKRAPRTLGACTCSRAEPRAIERPAVDTPALVEVPLATVPACRPVAAERADAPREAPAPVPGFRAPLLL